MEAGERGVGHVASAAENRRQIFPPQHPFSFVTRLEPCIPQNGDSAFRMDLPILINLT